MNPTQLKTYVADTEPLALSLARNELGDDCLILDVKTFQPKGLRGLFKKELVEVKAIYNNEYGGNHSPLEDEEINWEISHDEFLEAETEKAAESTEIEETLQDDFEFSKVNEGITFLREMNLTSLTSEENKTHATKNEEMVKSYFDIPEDKTLSKNFFGQPKEIDIDTLDEKINNLTVISDFNDFNKEEITKEDGSYSSKNSVVDDFYFTRDTVFKKKELTEKLEIEKQESAKEKILDKPKVETIADARLNKKTSNVEKLHKDVNKISRTFDVSLGRKNYLNKHIDHVTKILLAQGVSSVVAKELLKDAEKLSPKEKGDMKSVANTVYKNILKILNKTETINLDYAVKGDPKVVMFMGPTGVGKTTTIAKISSNFVFNEDVAVGLLTSDTYRIAAIEQLTTYAKILNLDIKVVYENIEFVDKIFSMGRNNELLMIDTAGRSHKNKEQMEELCDLTEFLRESEKYLVLSLTTKLEDLLEIVNAYTKICDFKIIFTKEDETNTLGNILNICFFSEKKISYLSTGQKVPDDIEALNPERIAKTLLGVGGNV